MFHCMKNLRWRLNFLRYEHSLKEISPVLEAIFLETFTYFRSKCVVPEHIYTHPRGLKAKTLIRKVSTKTVVSSWMGVGFMGVVWALSGTTIHSLFWYLTEKSMLCLIPCMLNFNWSLHIWWPVTTYCTPKWSICSCILHLMYCRPKKFRNHNLFNDDIACACIRLKECLLPK